MSAPQIPRSLSLQCDYLYAASLFCCLEGDVAMHIQSQGHGVQNKMGGETQETQESQQPLPKAGVMILESYSPLGEWM